MQPVHLPPATRVQRHRPGVDVPALRLGDIGEGVHRQADEPLQVLRLRVVRQRRLGEGGHPGDERFPDWHQAAESATKACEGGVSALLAVRMRPLSKPLTTII